jgi:hypothetical protein
MRLIAVLSVAVFSCVGALAAPRVKVDGKVLRTTPAPVIRGGKLYVPVDAFRRIGFYVDWAAGAKRGEICLGDSDDFVSIKPGRIWIEPEGPPPLPAPTVLPGKPFMLKGVLMVPLRTVVDHYHGILSVEWDARHRTAQVKRDPRWLNRRLEMDNELRKDTGHYAKPI